MKKFLFVAAAFDTAPCGAYNICHAHYESLCKLSIDRGTVISITSRKEKERPESGKISLKSGTKRSELLRNRLRGEFCITETENRIIYTAMNEAYDFIWFDDCIFGSTVQKIKQLRPELPVYVFYHIVPDTSIIHTVSENMFKRKGAILILNGIVRKRQQKLSAEYADVNVLLNDRDEMTFTELYGSRPRMILPACFVDTAHIEPVEKKPREFNILFIGGGGHFPNLHGIKWFAGNVMPSLDDRARLFIVGNMDSWKDSPEFKNNQRINITGRVESLDPYYNMADLVISPIFLGAGMMTKVAEAMMYGKNILATSHSLNGYPEIESQCRCDTPEEFITRINAMIETGTERSNPEMRRIFEKRYSVDAMTRILREDLVRRGII